MPRSMRRKSASHTVRVLPRRRFDDGAGYGSSSGARPGRLPLVCCFRLGETMALHARCGPTRCTATLRLAGGDAASAFVPGCSAGHLSFKQPANNLGCTHQSKNRHASDVQVRSQGRAVLLVCTSFHGISFIPHAGHEPRLLGGGLVDGANNFEQSLSATDPCGGSRATSLGIVNQTYAVGGREPVLPHEFSCDRLYSGFPFSWHGHFLSAAPAPGAGGEGQAAPVARMASARESGTSP